MSEQTKIKLFITDIDGCLTTPFEAPDWKTITAIRTLNEQSEQKPTIPPLSICSGRPLPYVEAVAQWLNVRKPVVFESGGVYELANNSLHLDGAFSGNDEQQIKELKQWITDEVLSRYPNGMLEFSKMMDAGFIHPDTTVVRQAFEQIKEHVGEHYPLLEVHRTDVSVNVILSHNNKRAGIQRLCDRLDISPAEVAYIGDTSGDIPGLQLVGHPFAPLNADNKVKDQAQLIERSTTEAVLEAYQIVIEENKDVIGD